MGAGRRLDAIPAHKRKGGDEARKRDISARARGAFQARGEGQSTEPKDKRNAER